MNGTIMPGQTTSERYYLFYPDGRRLLFDGIKCDELPDLCELLFESSHMFMQRVHFLFGDRELLLHL